MNSIPHGANVAPLPTPTIPVVSHTLSLTLSARRLAKRMGLAERPLVDAAVKEYRASGNPFAGKRALWDAAERLGAEQGGHAA